MVRRLLLLSGLLLVSGCAWPVRQTTDHVVCDLVNHPFDIAPEGATEAAKSAETPKGDSASSSTRSGRRSTAVPEDPTDVQTSALLELQRQPARRQMPLKDDAVQTAAWTQTQPGSAHPRRQAADTRLAYPAEATGVGGAGAQDIARPSRVGTCNRSHLSGAAAPAGRAAGPAGAGREALHAGRPPAPGRRQQPHAAAGGLGRRGSQGQPDSGEDLLQPHPQLLGGSIEQQ